MPAQLVLADPAHGWLLLLGSPAAGSAPQAILRTSNSGRSWTRVEFAYLNGHRSHLSLSSCNGAVANLSFINSTVGWATGQCGAFPEGKLISQTTDGGRAWHAVAVPTPGFKLSYFDPGQVTLVGRGLLLLPVSLTRPAAFILYRSIDGGMSWKPTSAIRARGVAQYIGPAMSYGPFSNLTSWVMLNGVLHRTTDGGNAWYVMARHSGLGAQPELDFVNQNDGFALRGPSSSHIFITTDSGRQWRKIVVRS